MTPITPANIDERRTVDIGNRFIHAEYIGTHGKTSVWDIVNRRSGTPIARVEWYGPWRQYVMQADFDAVWNDGCLLSVAGFLQRLNKGERP